MRILLATFMLLVTFSGCESTGLFARSGVSTFNLPHSVEPERKECVSLGCESSPQNFFDVGRAINSYGYGTTRPVHEGFAARF